MQSDQEASDNHTDSYADNWGYKWVDNQVDNRVDVNEKKLHLLKRKKKDVNDQKMQTTKSCVFLKRGKMKEKGGDTSFFHESEKS